jgi:hypothetical protein
MPYCELVVATNAPSSDLPRAFPEPTHRPNVRPVNLKVGVRVRLARPENLLHRNRPQRLVVALSSAGLSLRRSAYLASLAAGALLRAAAIRRPALHEAAAVSACVVRVFAWGQLCKFSSAGRTHG